MFAPVRTLEVEQATENVCLIDYEPRHESIVSSATVMRRLIRGQSESNSPFTAGTLSSPPKATAPLYDCESSMTLNSAWAWKRARVVEMSFAAWRGACGRAWSRPTPSVASPSA